MSKINKIPSEIRNFFKENHRGSAMEHFTKLLEGLKLDTSHLGGRKRENCQLTNLQVFQILVMLPFMAIKGLSHYVGSSLYGMFGGRKDILYSFMSQDNVDWRNVIYRVTGQLLKKTEIREDHRQNRLPSVLIADDSNLPKTGWRMEKIGKVFSHVHQKCILGYKALVLCWSDGITQYVLDASLHGEKGKTEGKEQGLTADQRNKRFSKERDGDSHISRRLEEYFMSKGDKLIGMVRRAIKSGVRFDYLLVDSWFTNTGLVEFVSRCRRRFHLLGMARMGKTKYQTSEWGEMNAKAIIDRLDKTKQIKYSRRLRCHYASVTVRLGKRQVKLFFCRMGRRNGWKVLLTTDLSLAFMRAYEIYAMRWSIEVFFSDSKRLLDLAGCSARDFSSQIAHLSLVIIRYNLLASVKRTLDYETIGALFNDIYEGVHELTVIDKIWNIILEVVAVVAELMDVDDEIVMEQILEKSERLEAFSLLAKSA